MIPSPLLRLVRYGVTEPVKTALCLADYVVTFRRTPPCARNCALMLWLEQDAAKGQR